MIYNWKRRWETGWRGLVSADIPLRAYCAALDVATAHLYDDMTRKSDWTLYLMVNDYQIDATVWHAAQREIWRRAKLTA